MLGRLDGPVATIAFARSFDVGSVRMTERHGEDREAIRQAAAEAFAEVPPLPSGTPVGVAGTMTTLAAVSLELSPYVGSAVHGHRLSRDSLAAVVARLAALDPRSRAQVPGLDPGRADVIVAGGRSRSPCSMHVGRR